MTVRKNFKLTISLIIILLFLAACKTGVQPPSQPISPDFFAYKVLLENKDTNDPIKNVEVKLDVPGSEIIISEYTDDDGFVLFNIENRFENEIANLTVNSDDHISEIHKITLLRGARSKRILLEKVKTNIELIETSIPPSATAPAIAPPTVEQASATSIPQTPTTSLTNTPTNTPVPISTDAPIPTPTNTPKNTPSPATATSSTPGLQVITDIQQQQIFTIPSTDGNILGILANNEELPAIARTADSTWYLVEYSDEYDGWVEASTTTLINGTAAMLPITDVLATSTPNGTNPPPSTCVTSWHVYHADDVRIRWDANTYPNGTNHLMLEAFGQDVNGVWKNEALVEKSKVDITNSNLVQEGYLVSGWQFDQGGFLEAGQFKYSLSAHAQNGNEICTQTYYFKK